MHVRDLGALAIESGDVEHVVGGSKAAAVLAMLAINVNQRVSVDALMAATWGDRVSAGSASTLESLWGSRTLLQCLTSGFRLPLRTR